MNGAFMPEVAKTAVTFPWTVDRDRGGGLGVGPPPRPPPPTLPQDSPQTHTHCEQGGVTDSGANGTRTIFGLCGRGHRIFRVLYPPDLCVFKMLRLKRGSQKGSTNPKENFDPPPFWTPLPTPQGLGSRTE